MEIIISSRTSPFFLYLLFICFLSVCVFLSLSFFVHRLLLCMYLCPFFALRKSFMLLTLGLFESLGLKAWLVPTGSHSLAYSSHSTGHDCSERMKTNRGQGLPRRVPICLLRQRSHTHRARHARHALHALQELHEFHEFHELHEFHECQALPGLHPHSVLNHHKSNAVPPWG
jgi:hypothetical protein